MTKLKINKLQQRILNEIVETVNDSMTINDKLKIVRSVIDRYERQLNNLRIDDTLKKMAAKEKEIEREV